MKLIVPTRGMIKMTDLNKQIDKIVCYFDKKLTRTYISHEYLRMKALKFMKEVDPDAIGWDGCNKKFLENNGDAYCNCKNRCIYKTPHNICDKNWNKQGGFKI